MALEVRFYTNYSKRDNSTKQPAATAPYTTANVILKEPTSIESPTLLLSGNHFDYEYAYIPSYNKYYFVSQHVSAGNGLIQISLEEDVMATYKSTIGNTVAHIVYSSTGYDVQLIDSRCTSKTTKTITHATGGTTHFDTTGCYILSVIGVESSANGFATCYICDRNDLANVASVLMGLDIDQRVIKAIYQPFDCIISCTWLPVSKTTLENLGTVTSVYFGDYDSSIVVSKLSNPVIGGSLNFSLTPKYTDFRAAQPYTTYSLVMPFYGSVDINASDIRDELASGGLSGSYAIDCASGDVTVVLYNDSDVIQTFNYNVGVNCPIAQTSTNMTGTISGIGGTAGGILGTVISMASGNVPGALASGVATLTSATSIALQANGRGVSIKGGINGRSSNILGTDFTLVEFAMDTEDPNNASYIAKWGRPVAQTHAINTHSGYVQCESASVDIPGTETERSKINSYLNGGFYYE